MLTVSFMVAHSTVPSAEAETHTTLMPAVIVYPNPNIKSLAYWTIAQNQQYLPPAYNMCLCFNMMRLDIHCSLSAADRER